MKVRDLDDYVFCGVAGLMIVTDIGVTALGAPPLLGLLTAVGGGLPVGLLLRLALQILQEAEMVETAEPAEGSHGPA